MKHFFIILLLSFLVFKNVDAKCNTYLSPRDNTSKYIDVINCLNDKINSLEEELLVIKSQAASAAKAASSAASRAAAAEEAANRAADYAMDTNSKLDRMFKKAMMLDEDEGQRL